MAVIKDDMITKNITRRDVLPLGFLKKSTYTGSKRAMNYKMAKTEVPVETAASETAAESNASAGQTAAAPETAPEPEMKTVLRVYVWPGPFAFDMTDAEKIEHQDFEFKDSGIDEALIYLNEKLTEYDQEVSV